MRTLKVEMPEVRDCTASSCGYNVAGGCHAKAVTVGDGETPSCDTFFVTIAHVRNVQIQAGVGACKVSSCQFNQDYACMAENIQVGLNGKGVQCLTYRPVQAGQGSRPPSVS